MAPSIPRRALLTGGPALTLSAWLAACVKPRPVQPIDRGSHDPLAVQRAITRGLARSFLLRHDEERVFANGWALYKRIVHGSDGDSPERRAELHAAARTEIRAAMGRVRDACQGHPSTMLGHRRVRREPVEGRRWVIFSDHHRIYHGHRTNFFAESGNLWLYTRILEHYLEAGYTLVENGDVEDLVIFDPAWEPGEVALRRDLDLPGLKARRLVQRLAQLKRILADPMNEPLYDRLAQFDADHRLIYVSGNHDYDLQRGEFHAVLRRRLPHLEVPYDYLLLDRADRTGARRVAFAILHGHQLDMSTNPVSAPRLGETVSECLGLYFQGPDRWWRWSYDDVGAWASARRPFLDHLAVDRTDLETSTLVDLGLLDFAELDFDVDRNPGLAKSNLRDLWHRMGEKLFQDLFKQDIGWDYFRSVDPKTGVVVPRRAFANEVLTGERFFKFRILDEEFVRDQVLATFPDPTTRPTLILGHSHEPRLSPWSRRDQEAFPWYLNTASAGRFENLVWGVEIVDGVANLVSWSRASPPEGEVTRRVWSVVADGPPGRMQAASAPSPVPR